MDRFAEFIGRSRIAEDVITARDARRLAQVLGTDAPAETLPPLWHWLGWTPDAPHEALAADGHPKRGDFLPDTDQPRRMWAGGRLRWEGSLRLGEVLRRETTIAAVTEKSGKSGAMIFVTLTHRITGAAGAIVEVQDLVFTALPEAWVPPPARPAPPAPDWSEVIEADSVRLFRFSALTYNGHRIHYDHPYTSQVEHYPGLVVHGPLQALWLADRATRHRGAAPAEFAFRSIRPAFAGPLTLCGWGERLATVAPDGALCMTAEIG